MVGRTNLESPTALRFLDFQIELLREIKLDFFYHFVRRETETNKSALTIETLHFFLFTGSPSDTGRLNNSNTNRFSGLVLVPNNRFDVVPGVEFICGSCCWSLTPFIKYI